ncbi:MAG: hypothetical protein ACR2JB_08425 [Bryobacteraceae bacterium]
MVRQTEAILLFLSTATHFALILLPCFAACAIAVRKGLHDTVLVGLTVLVVLGISGYLAFWLWFISPQLGRLFSLCLPIASVLILILTLKRIDAAGRSTLRALLVPLALTGSAALLVVSTGFLFGGVDYPSETARTRFSHPLPPDNEIPFLFAEGLRNGKVPRPLLAEWRSSDRPPLQTGIVLSQCVYLQHPRKLQYTIISVILQSLWIFALWLFLEAFDLNSKSIALALAVCLFSGFVFLNSFYVWPKLLAAAYMLAASAVLLADRFTVALSKTTFTPLLAAVLVAFGVLAHGASVFAVLGLALTIIALKRRITLSSLILIGVGVFCLYLPWMLYQKLYDPPGDRLLKWHLAGVIAVNSQSFIQAFTTTYKDLTFHQFLNNKLANLETVADHQREYWHSILQLMRELTRGGSRNSALIAQATADLRALGFFFFVPSLGFLVIGPLSLLVGIRRRYRSREWKAGGIAWLYVAFTTAVWCLLIFLPGSTVLHTTAYVMVLLAFAGSIIALWAASPWLALVLGVLQIGFNFLLYILFMPLPLPTGSPDQASLRFGTLTLALLSLVCSCLLLRTIARRQTSLPSVNAQP